MGKVNPAGDPALELLERSPVPILIFQDGLIVYANRATCEVTGYRPDVHGPLVGRPVYDCIAPEERDAARANAEKVAHQGRADRSILRTLFHPITGERFETLAAIAPVRWQGRLALEVSFMMLEGAGLGSARKGHQASLGALTVRQREIALLVARGYETHAIAARLAIREATVRTHLKTIYRRTGTHSRLQLAQLVQGATDAG